MFLARKISRAKWGPKKGLLKDEIPADAITGDMRTKDNALSFWECGEGIETEVEEVALVLAAASERIDKIDIVWLSDDELRADGQTLENTKGRTPVKDLIERHVDVSRLDYGRLGKVASRVVAAIEQKHYRRLAKDRVKDLLAVAVKENRIELADLEKRVRIEVCELLEAEK